MCCRITISPLNRDLAIAVLTIGRFVKVESGDRWVRELPEEGTHVAAHFTGDELELVIGPAISEAAHHAQKRRAAGVYFEIACKYAEKVGGTITQKANVEGCMEGALTSRVLARYPDEPMDFEKVCNGFRAAFYAELEVFTE